MENVILAVFAEESQAYEAFSQLKGDAVNADFSILEMAVVRNEDGRIVEADGFDSGVDTSDNTLIGGLVGGIVGILGGPWGILLGGSVGLLAGSIVDTSDATEDASLLEQGTHMLGVGRTAVIALVQEADEQGFNSRLADYGCTITRWDAAVVADEVEHAQEAQRQMAKEARERMHAHKRAERKQAIEEKRAAIKERFERLKAKL